MLRLFLGVILISCLSIYAYSAGELTPEQQNELAKEIGVILIGMTKVDVKETFGLLQPKVWFTPEGQEVWYYQSPERQNIYFKNNKVERVGYIQKKKDKPKRDKGEPEEI